MSTGIKAAHAPWQWEKVTGEQVVTEWSLKGPTVLCRFWHDNPPDADARLIASVPEQHEALIAGHTHFIQNNKLTADDREVLDLMWAAIQKARGA